MKNHKPFKTIRASGDLLAEMKINATTFHSLAAAFDQGLFILDMGYQIAYANDAGIKLCYKAFTVLLQPGMNMLHQLPAATAHQLKKDLRKVISGRQVCYETEIVKPYGSSVWMRCQYFPVTDNNAILGIGIVLTDNTEKKVKELADNCRKSTEEKLYYQPDVFELFMQNAPFTAWVTDKYGKMHYMNKPFLTLLNLTKKDIGKTHWDIFGQERGDIYQANNLRALTENKTIETIERSINAAGDELIYKVFKFPLYFQGQTMIGGWSVDITEQLRLKNRIIRQEKNKKRAIVRSVIDAQEKEKRQLSVELHDNVNQILSSCKLMLEAACENKEYAPVLTEKSAEGLQLAITEIRKISHQLNPSTIEDIGLVEAISDMVERINMSNKLCILFHHHKYREERPIKIESKIAIYRIVQEQLNNILKHASAHNVQIMLCSNKSKTYIVIEDDGIGFDVQQTRKGIGLKSIQHRVAYYKGKMKIESSPGKGCKLKVLLKGTHN